MYDYEYLPHYIFWIKFWKIKLPNKLFSIMIKNMNLHSLVDKLDTNY